MEAFPQLLSEIPANMNVARVALPGYNALSDTNLDHFSLYADVDNVLIKRKLSGTATIADGSPTTLTIPHNLGYIPFFMVYYFDELTSEWVILNNQYNNFSIPQQVCACDTTNLKILNYGGHGSGHLQVAYEIFYDNMNDTTAPVITESAQVFKVARPGVNALVSKNPNDYIMHSDLNNFKILKQGIIHTDIASISSYSFAHGANVQAPFKYLLFLQDDEDSKYTLLGGSAGTHVYDEGIGLITSTMDVTNITLSFPTQTASPELVTIKYYIYGSGKANTVSNAGNIIAVAKAGSNVQTETNPDDYNFHSNYATLKYSTSGVYSMTVSATTVHAIPHGLGYVPFFIGFVNDLANNIGTSNYAIIPYYWGRSSLGSPNQDIAAFMYADATNIYVKAFYQPNAVGTTKTFNFYYKIFKNNLSI